MAAHLGNRVAGIHGGEGGIVCQQQLLNLLRQAGQRGGAARRQRCQKESETGAVLAMRPLPLPPMQASTLLPWSLQRPSHGCPR